MGDRFGGLVREQDMELLLAQGLPVAHVRQVGSHALPVILAQQSQGDASPDLLTELQLLDEHEQLESGPDASGREDSSVRQDLHDLDSGAEELVRDVDVHCGRVHHLEHLSIGLPDDDPHSDQRLGVRVDTVRPEGGLHDLGQAGAVSGDLSRSLLAEQATGLDHVVSVLRMQARGLISRTGGSEDADDRPDVWLEEVRVCSRRHAELVDTLLQQRQLSDRSWVAAPKLSRHVRCSSVDSATKRFLVINVG